MVTLFGFEKGGEKQVEAGTIEASKPVNPQDLSTFTQKYLTNQKKRYQSYFSGTESTIRVSEVLGNIALLYEKIRNVVEYKGEHVLRRNAIERILKRLLWEHAGHDTQRIAQILLRELIWAHYLPNDFVPKSKVNEVAKIIGKYLYFLGKLSDRGTGISPQKLREWVWGIASCEIEESVEASSRETYVELMYEWFMTYFIWTDDGFSDHEKQIQIYLAIHRGLAKSDDEIMRYHLLLKEYPGWFTADEHKVNEVVENFYKLYEEIEKHLQFSDAAALFRTVKKQVAPFEILRDLVETEGHEAQNIIADTEKFEWKIREICQKKYAQIQRKVNRGIVRSILYIFVTKVLLAILIEVPYELARFGSLTILPLAINVVVPPGMMWLLGLTIRAPGEDNTQRLISKLKTIVYQNQHVVKTAFSLTRVKRGSQLAAVFSVIYLILFVFVFGGITYLFMQLHFTWLGILIFFAFLSLVLLFGYRVRFTATELKVMGDKENILSYVFNNLTLPFLSTGVYLSKGLAKINFLTVILDFLIEAPLKTIIEVVEEWTSFIREKREEVVEVPEQ